jgi:folate-dependent phosphoribosylglycinamide formyltransferase PurN
MRTVLICHAEDDLNRIGTARWLASFTDLAGIVIIQEGGLSTWRRVRREIRRSGWLFLAGADHRREREILADLCARYPELSASTRILRTATPNSRATAGFLRECAPDLVIARCKVLLREEIFTVPRAGTFVLHPGICPEYRNAHGCFWALANRDLSNVGLTLLKIDRGVDTGPVYGYYRYPFEEATESHIVIQHRSAFENLDSIAEKLREIHQGVAQPLDTGGRIGSVWGQPWLSKYLHWKSQAGSRRS